MRTDNMEALARAAVHKYLELMNAGLYGEVGSLFHDDAAFQAPTGEVLHGRVAIAAFYASALPRIRPVKVWASSQVTEGPSSVIEISAILPDGPDVHTVLDHFTVDKQGLVTRLAVYVTAAELQNTLERIGSEE